MRKQRKGMRSMKLYGQGHWSSKSKREERERVAKRGSCSEK